MSETQRVDIQANLDRLEERVSAACSRVGRDRRKVIVVAVTKTRSVEEIVAAYHCGVRHFGENRVEEAELKVPGLREGFAADPATWHMVGHVQSRKARRTVAVSDIIHSVDSLRLARRLDRFAAESGRRVPILLELNVSGEASKYGFPVYDAARAAFFDQVEEFSSFEHLDVQGLMTMAPIVSDAEEARPVFRQLRQVRDELRDRAPLSPWAQLSMGMTDDFEVAIEEGATMVRIGRAIFGPGNY